MKFGRSLARNVRFGSLFCEISRKPRTKRSFWKLCSMKFGGSLARNARFGRLFCEISRKPRTKRLFWKLVLGNFEEASHKTFVLEACSVKFWGSLARNARFGSLFCEISRKPRTKRSFCELVLWNFEEASHETIFLEACSLKFRGSLARNDRFGSCFCARNARFASLCCEISKKPRTKRSFWELFVWKLSEASREMLVLEACSVKFGGSLARNDRFGLWNLVLVAAFSY